MWNLLPKHRSCKTTWSTGWLWRSNEDKEGSNDGDIFEEEEDRNDDTEVELVDGENECPVLNIFELLQNPTFVEDDDVWIIIIVYELLLIYF